VAISAPSARIRFDVFEADLRSGELRKHGLKIKLHQQPFQVLTALLEHPGEVVTREELQARLWPSDTFVDFEVGLNSAVKKLREALRDSAETPRFIETLPRRGYRFIAAINNALPVEAPATVTPQELEDPGNGAADERTRKTSLPFRRRWLIAGFGVAVLAAGCWFFGKRLLQRQSTSSTATPAQIRAIAVLPLENLTGDPGQDYFADGMTDALITDLAQISSLKVISRTSTMRYKRTQKTLPEIGNELNVDGIVEGAVIRSGERVRVDAQLIEAKSDRHIWASTYERNLGDVISLQNEVARAVVNQIQARLTPQEQAHLLRSETVDPQTYELYLRGRHFWNKRDEESIRKSIDSFQHAIQRSPNYAAAYAGVAEAYVVRDDVPPQESFSAAKAAAHRALEMDESLAAAHNALAMSLFAYDWDWTGAEKEFQRAIALNPNYAQAHQWYAQYLRTMGRQDAAVEELKHAEELDPISPVIAGGSGRYGKQYDVMIEHAKEKLELDPNSFATYRMLGTAYALKGMYRESIAAYQKARDLSAGAPHSLADLGYTYAICGKRAEALNVIGELEELSKHRYVSPYYFALIYTGLGEKDTAFTWLQKAVGERSISLASFRTGEELANLRSDARYRELLNRIGLPQ